MNEAEIGELYELDDLRQCELIQREVWRFSDTEVVSAVQLRALLHAGSFVAGARQEGKLVGFCYGIPALSRNGDRSVGLHSDMAAVLPAYREGGIGQALKRFQRDWCAARGLGWIQWTFDPLRARNARLNLEHLGARVNEYLIDAYGVMADALNAGIPSDRLMAHWKVEGDTGLQGEPNDAAGSGAAEPGAGTTHLPDRSFEVLPRRPDGMPGVLERGRGDELIAIAIPKDIDEFRQGDRDALRAWRLAVREAFLEYLAAGYVAVGFRDDRYLLMRDPPRSAFPTLTD